MMILRAKNLSLVCTLAMLVCVYDAPAQIPRPRLPTTVPAPAATAPNAPTASDDAAAAQATTECIEAGNAGEAAGVALLFGGGGEEGAEESDISKYLVGLCVPPALSEQYALNEYLLAKGAMYNFYALRSFEELGAHLDASGAELGVKFEALQKDSALTAALSASNGLEKAVFMLNQNQTLATNVARFVPALATLQSDQQTEARSIAARVRSFALNSSYFLSRGVYVSQKMASTIAANTKEQAGGLRTRARGAGSNPLDAASGIAGATGEQAEQLRAFAEFVKKNGKAVAAVLGGMINVVKTLDPDSTEIPKLEKKDLDAYEKRYNQEWDMPAEFRDEATYGPANTFVES